MNIHVTILGKEPLPIYYPIAEFKPDVVHLIGTDQNKEVSARLDEILKSKGLQCFVHQVVATDIKQITELCESFHTNANADDVFMYNLTGGTKLMAISAFSVATKHNATVIYTDSKECYNVNTYDHFPLNTKLDNKTIFELQGQKLKSFQPYVRNREVVEACKKIMNFKLKNRFVFSALIDYYNPYRHVEKMPDNFSTREGISFHSDGDKLTVSQNDEIVFSIDCPGSKHLLFEGCWWETLVADKIYKWSNGRFDIWQSVAFLPKDEVPEMPAFDKNEVDILVDVGNTFIFVECKAGKITQDHIYKMDYVRTTYGSEKSKSVLISFYTVTDDLKEKAYDKKLDIIDAQKIQGKLVTTLKQIDSKMDEILNSIKA